MASRKRLTRLILAALVLGIGLGQFLHDPARHPGLTDGPHLYATVLTCFKSVGSDIFMGLLKMLIIPLIISSIIYGMAQVGGLSSLGRLGAKTLVYYVTTMPIAVVTGLLLVQAIGPGVGTIKAEQIDQALRQYRAGHHAEQPATTTRPEGPATLGDALLSLVGEMISRNTPL